MQSKKNYVAIDLGATSGRVILASLENGVVDMETVSRFRTPLVCVRDKYYWDIYFIYENIVNALTQIGSRGIKIESIGVDAWGVDFACVSKDGSVCIPRSYRDPYTEGVQKEFFKKMPDKELYDRTGIQIMNFNSVFQLFALHKEKSSALENAKSILFMPDAISYLLTGKKVCEYTILSTSALMNPRTKKLDKDILRVCHVKKNRFGKIVMPGAEVGRLSESLARSTGLGRVVVKAVAGHDTASAVAAIPATGSNFAYLSSGTWSLMGIETPQPVIDESMFSLNYTNEGGVGGTIRLLKNITGMWILEQCLAKWRTEGFEYDYPQIQKMAEDSPASGYFINPNDPSFSCPQDMPAAIAAFCRSHGQKVPETHAETVRLIYDSLAAQYAEVLNNLRKVAPFKIETLHIIGGGSKNSFLNQLTADACGIEVVAGPAEGTALGNVMIQAGLSREQLLKSVKTETFKPKPHYGTD